MRFARIARALQPECPCLATRTGPQRKCFPSEGSVNTDVLVDSIQEQRPHELQTVPALQPRAFSHNVCWRLTRDLPCCRMQRGKACHTLAATAEAEITVEEDTVSRCHMPFCSSTQMHKPCLQSMCCSHLDLDLDLRWSVWRNPWKLSQAILPVSGLAVLPQQCLIESRYTLCHSTLVQVHMPFELYKLCDAFTGCVLLQLSVPLIL